ncbi:MAG: glycosyltransferase involved in cell wall biosynthesis [Olleya marilimosa]|jgi:glycosyltransferase involved in cell wall biosynthesis|uniref:glycosyltransferase n=1 Tax=Olleya marilimosa TaxID=272164 RepID=UPI0004888028|nr:glycosyltransferase [Olleya marilimosa]
MVKVVILVNTLNSGGSERQSIMLFNVLKSDFSTTLIVIHPEKIEQNMLNLIEGDNYNLVKLEGSFFYKFKILCKFLKENNTTHVFNFLTKPNLIGAIASKKAKVRNVYSGIRTTTLPFWKFFIEKVTSNYLVTGTIYNSYSGAKIFTAKGLTKSIVIPNCFPLINDPIIRNRNNKITNIITVGRFVKAKDYLTSILVIKQLLSKGENVHYTIVGYGILESKIRQWIINYELENHITMIINPKNIPELLLKSDIYLSTSLFEGTSNSIMEAMNASLPIVATDVGDNKELVIDGVNGFVEEVSDFKSLAVAVQNILKGIDNQKNMGVESNIILKDRYSLKNYKLKYRKLIDKK